MTAETPTQIAVMPSKGLGQWLMERHISLAFTTYQTNRLCFIGCKADGRLAFHERLFDKPMGLFAQQDRLVMTTRYQIWELENQLASGETFQGADCLYVPSRSYTTGDINAHDIVVDSLRRIVFVNTRFSCLATLEAGYSFAPIWQPAFISHLAPEDRCHLNGLALRDGKPAYATACSRTDSVSGWRMQQQQGGVALDIASYEVMAAGLSMPHSPRWYQGKLWLLNSGTGQLGYIDDGRFNPVTRCLGFVRGLAFYGQYAIVGLSILRAHSLADAMLQAELLAQGQTARCGLAIINLATGVIEHSFYFNNLIEELFDVVVVPGVRQPKALGLQNDDIERIVRMPGADALTIMQPSVKSSASKQPIRAAGLPKIPDAQVQPIKYQRIYHLTPANLAHYESLTYPSLQKRWQSEPLRGELFGVSAAIEGELIGLVVAEVFVDSHQQSCAELVSLSVLPPYRDAHVADKLIQLLQLIVGQPLDPVSIKPLDPQ